MSNKIINYYNIFTIANGPMPGPSAYIHKQQKVLVKLISQTETTNTMKHMGQFVNNELKFWKLLYETNGAINMVLAYTKGNIQLIQA